MLYDCITYLPTRSTNVLQCFGRPGPLAPSRSTTYPRVARLGSHLGFADVNEVAAGIWHAGRNLTAALRNQKDCAALERFPEEPNRARSRNARRAIPRSWLCASATRCERA